MENPRIIYPTAEGGVAVIIPAPDCGLTLEQIAAKDVPAGLAYSVVESASIPSDRTFRNAWEHSEGKVSVSVTKAKAIHLDRLREMRKPKLEALDVEFMRAVEAGDTVSQKAISEKKQALRDVTKAELPSDLDELKAFIPEVLK